MKINPGKKNWDCIIRGHLGVKYPWSNTGYRCERCGKNVARKNKLGRWV